MAITLRSTSTAAGDGGSLTVAVNTPSGVIAGDVLFALLSFSGPVTTTPPSGWVTVAQNSGSTVSISMFYKVATDAEPTSYSFSISAYYSSSIVLADYIGVSNSSPLNGAPVVGVVGQQTPFPKFNSLTTSVPGCRILECLSAYPNSADTFTPPSGYTLDVAGPYSAYAQAFLAGANQSAAGASGNESGNLAQAAALTTYTVALSPAQTAVTGTITYTNANDTSVGTGQVGVNGSSAAVDANDTPAITGKLGVNGLLSAASASDTCAISGLVNVYGGTLSYTNQADLLAGTAKIGVQGSVSAQDFSDTSSVSGFYSINGVLVGVGGNAAMSALGGICVAGALRVSTVNDDLAAFGKIGVGGTIGALTLNDNPSIFGFYQAVWVPISPASGTWTPVGAAPGSWSPISPASGAWTPVTKH